MRVPGADPVTVKNLLAVMLRPHYGDGGDTHICLADVEIWK